MAKKATLEFWFEPMQLHPIARAPFKAFKALALRFKLRVRPFSKGSKSHVAVNKAGRTRLSFWHQRDTPKAGEIRCHSEKILKKCGGTYFHGRDRLSPSGKPKPRYPKNYKGERW